jgi:pimeloyl-ACP methyl ester carboxylesterase
VKRPTLLLLPGLLCDAAAWEPQREAFAATHRIVIADYGDADSLPEMARRALAQVGDLETDVAIAGHSMGGRIAFEVWRLARERVGRLALLDTGAHPLADGEAGERERAGRMALLGIARRQGMRAMAAEWARGMVHPDRIDGPVFEAVLDMFERKTPEIFAAQIDALLGRADAAPLLRTIDVPTLFATGAEDAWSPPAQHAQMQRAVRSSRLAVFAQCGHMSTIEQPDAVNRALADWLAA